MQNIKLIICLLFLLLFTGCAKITHEIVGEPDVTYKSDPIYVYYIVTGNFGAIPTGSIQ